MGLNDILIRKLLGNTLTGWVRQQMDKDGRARSNVKVIDLQLERDKDNRIHATVTMEIVADERNVNDLIDKIM